VQQEYVEPGLLGRVRAEATGEQTLPFLPQAPRDPISDFFESLKTQANKEVRVTIRWRPPTSFGKHVVKGTAPVDIETFILQDFYEKVGQMYGPGEYIFDFSVKQEGKAPYSFRHTENIDLTIPSALKDEQPYLRQPSSDPNTTKILEAVQQSNAAMAAAVTGLAGIVRENIENQQTKHLERIEAALVERNNAPISSQPIQSPTELINSVADTFVKLQETARASIPQFSGPQQMPMEVIKSQADMFKLGLETAKEVLKMGGGGEAAEAPEGSGGVSGILERVASGVVTQVLDRFSGGNQQQQTAVPAQPADPAVSYVQHTLGNLSRLYSQGATPEASANWLRQNLTPAQIQILLNQPVSNLIQGIPSLSQYQTQLATTITALRPKLPLRRTPPTLRQPQQHPQQPQQPQQQVRPTANTQITTTTPTVAPAATEVRQTERPIPVIPTAPTEPTQVDNGESEGEESGEDDGSQGLSMEVPQFTSRRR
jgi:hypothetical protein